LKAKYGLIIALAVFKFVLPGESLNQFGKE